MIVDYTSIIPLARCILHAVSLTKVHYVDLSGIFWDCAHFLNLRGRNCYTLGLLVVDGTPVFNTSLSLAETSGRKSSATRFLLSLFLYFYTATLAAVTLVQIERTDRQTDRDRETDRDKERQRQGETETRERQTEIDRQRQRRIRKDFIHLGYNPS